MALYFPALPLEVYQRACAARRPLAITQGAVVVACNQAASRFGVRPGMPRLAALALGNALHLRPRRGLQERAALERLAAVALEFSDHVSLEPPQGLVIEAERSFRLFDGPAAFFHNVVARIAALGYQVRACIAPSPSGALLLASWGIEKTLCDAQGLRQQLAQLPLAALDLGARERLDAQRMGLYSLGALMALPRAGFAQRFGINRLQQLERLLGERADPKPRFSPPESFHGELELPVDVSDANALIFACRRLLDELCGSLRARQAVVPWLDWTWRHVQNRQTRVRLGSARPDADAGRWLLLLRERLARSPLSAPVQAIVLEAGPFEYRAVLIQDLFGRRQRHDNAAADLIDRLRARLGEEAVKTVAPVADHRPERAWRWAEPEFGARTGKRSETLSDSPSSERYEHLRAKRPVWLFLPPVRLQWRGKALWLADATGMPDCLGKAGVFPLYLMNERERIETGWWDAESVARDYFPARARNGEIFWVYRCLENGSAWFLQGVFDGWRPGSTD